MSYNKVDKNLSTIKKTEKENQRLVKVIKKKISQYRED